MVDKLVIKKGNKEIAVGSSNNVSFKDENVAGSIISAGTYKALYRNEMGDSPLVEVPQTIVRQSTMTLPLLELIGDVDDMTKENKKVLQVKFTEPTGKTNFEGYTKTGWQGASSIGYPKKNYGLKLYTDQELTTKLNVTMKDKWFATNKYVLKANYVDATHARNVVTARLWKQIMTDTTSVEHYSSDEVYKRISANNQYGSIDGFPIEVMINGESQGLYTFNLDNTADLFGLTDTDTDGLLMYAKGWGNVTQFWSAEALLDGSSGDFKAEFPEPVTETQRKQVFDLIANTAIYGTDTFKSYWDTAYNIYNLIDYVLFMNLMNANDNVCNNVGYVTFNGVKFWLTPYDLDGTWSLSSGGTWINEHNKWQKGTTEMVNAFTAYPDIAVARWNELKTNVFNKDNIMDKFNGFKSEVGDYGYTLDKSVWEDIPSRTLSTYEQISKGIDDGIAFMDQCADDNFSIVTTQKD